MKKIRSPRILFWDIETSPNIVMSWHIGQKVSLSTESIVEERKIICICYKWSDEKAVKSLTWDKDKCDKSLLEKFSPILSSADFVVAHNGDKYDYRFFNGRLLKHGLSPVNDVVTVDTLKYARKAFFLNSNKLDYIARYLGLGKKADNGGMDTWKKICLEGCDKAMKRMVKYCKVDVLILEAVYNSVKAYMPIPKINMSNQLMQKECCPSCGEKNSIKQGRRVRGKKLHQRYQCQSCGHWHSRVITDHPSPSE